MRAISSALGFRRDTVIVFITRESCGALFGGDLGGRNRSALRRRAASNYGELLRAFDERAPLVYAANPKKRPHEPKCLQVDQGR